MTGLGGEGRGVTIALGRCCDERRNAQAGLSAYWSMATDRDEFP
jgi:hypothetical protein